MERDKVYPVRGQVIFVAPAPQRAMVIFHPLGQTDPSTRPSFATLAQDGSFELGTYSANDGAPAGEYAVTLTWEMPASGVEDDAGPDLLRDTVYSDPERTPLKITVEPRPNELAPFKIEK